MIKNGMFLKVDFWFDDRSTMESYQKYFDREYWPETSYDKKKRTAKALPEKVRILANDHVRGRVTFNFIDLKKPRLFTLDEACRTKKSFKYSYEERKHLYAMDAVDRKAAELEARLEEEREQERQEAAEAKSNLVQQIKETLAEIDQSEIADGTYKAAALDFLGKYKSKTADLRKKLIELTEQLAAS